jgi:hypothetical protein
MIRSLSRLSSASAAAAASSGSLPHIALISSHHIYCDSKKEHIVIGAAHNNLGLIYLYGKPGRLVVEGELKALQRYWANVSSWRWQEIKLMMAMRPTHEWRRESAQLMLLEQRRAMRGSLSTSKKTATRFDHDQREKEERQRWKQKQKQHSRRDTSILEDDETLSGDAETFSPTDRCLVDDARAPLVVEANSEAHLRQLLTERGLCAAIPVIERPFNAQVALSKR